MSAPDWRVLVLCAEGHCDSSSGIGISSEGQRSDLKVPATLWERESFLSLPSFQPQVELPFFSQAQDFSSSFP